MSEFDVTWHERDYGSKATGTVLADDREVPIIIREPHEGDFSGITYVLATGWTAHGNAMTIPAHEIVDAGHRAVTLNYTGNKLHGMLDSNARDVAAVSDALPHDERKRAIGLSMGGHTAVASQVYTKQYFEAITMVNSAGLFTRVPGPLEIGTRLLAETTDFKGHLLHPISAMHIARGVVANCTSRPIGVIGELGELTTLSVHGILDMLNEDPTAPFIRALFAAEDRLIPLREQLAGVITHPSIAVETIIGGHTGPAYDRSIIRRILNADLALAEPTGTEDVPVAF